MRASKKPQQPTPEEQAIIERDRKAEKARKLLIQAQRGTDVEMLLGELHMRASERRIPRARISKGSFDTSITIRVERSWGVNVDLDIRFSPDFGKRIEDTENNISYTPCDYEVLVNWSACRRSLPQALAAANLYREIIDLAADLEAIIQGANVYHVERHGLDETPALHEPVEAK